MYSYLFICVNYIYFDIQPLKVRRIKRNETLSNAYCEMQKIDSHYQQHY